MGDGRRVYHVGNNVKCSMFNVCSLFNLFMSVISGVKRVKCTMSMSIISGVKSVWYIGSQLYNGTMSCQISPSFRPQRGYAYTHTCTLAGGQ